MSAALKLRSNSGRSEDRRNVAFSLSARVNGESRAFEIGNVSENGILLSGTRGLRVGTIIEFSIPEDGWCAAEAVRSEGGATGCRFFQPISQAAIASMLLRSQFAHGSIRSESEPQSGDDRVQDSGSRLVPIDMRGAAVMLFVLCVMLGIVLVG
ncbi:PilZ domain-containing protein [Croceicoccus naphthovorans]